MTDLLLTGFPDRKNQSEEINKMAFRNQTYCEQWLTLKGRVEVAIINNTCVIIYGPTVLHCPDSCLANLKRIFFRFLVEGQWTACEALDLLPTVTNIWAEDSEPNDAHATAEAETAMAPP